MMHRKSPDSAYQSAARIAIRRSATHIVLRSVLVIFTIEFGVMLALRASGYPITPMTPLLDSLILSALALPILYFVILRPIARLAAEQAAAAAESRFQMIAQAVPEGILIFGLDRRVRFANSAAERMLHYSPGALPGLDVGALLPEQVVEQFRQPVSALAELGPPRSTRKSFTRKGCGAMASVSHWSSRRAPSSPVGKSSSSW